MTEAVRYALVDWYDSTKLASIVASQDDPSVKWVVAVNYDWSKIWSSSGVSTVKSTIIDESSITETYVWKAIPWTLTSEALWSIKKIDSTNPTTIYWADSWNYTQVRDDRASLSYS